MKKSSLNSKLEKIHAVKIAIIKLEMEKDELISRVQSEHNMTNADYSEAYRVFEYQKIEELSQLIKKDDEFFGHEGSQNEQGGVNDR